MILVGFLFNGRYYKSLKDLQGKTVSIGNQPLPLYMKNSNAHRISVFDTSTLREVFKDSMKLLKRLVKLQNGPPLANEEDEWNETITDIEFFLEENRI